MVGEGEGEWEGEGILAKWGANTAVRAEAAVGKEAEPEADVGGVGAALAWRRMVKARMHKAQLRGIACVGESLRRLARTDLSRLASHTAPLGPTCLP